MLIKIQWHWEKLDENTYRAKVIGGWLVSHVPFTPSSSKSAPSNTAVFIPDKDHQWLIVEPPVETQPQASKLAADFARKA